MAKRTRRQKIQEALENAGWREVPSPSRKYVKMVHPRDIRANGALAYWLGKSGAVRRGRTVSDSVSVTEQVRAYIG